MVRSITAFNLIWTVNYPWWSIFMMLWRHRVANLHISKTGLELLIHTIPMKENSAVRLCYESKLLFYFDGFNTPVLKRLNCISIWPNWEMSIKWKRHIGRCHASSTGLYNFLPWWRHQMERFSALLALCAGNSPVPVNSPHKGQWRGALMFSLIYVRINGWVNNREAGDLRRYRAHYDVIVMLNRNCSLTPLFRSKS